MSGDTSIQWTDKVWNPLTGCTRVSAGCDHCYAFATHDKRHLAWKRGRWDAAPAQYHVPFSRVQLLPERLTEPLHWRKPKRVFVNSMGDLFHEDVPDEFIDRVFAVMTMAPQHTFIVLTKRPERMQEYMSGEHVAGNWMAALDEMANSNTISIGYYIPEHFRVPLPNVQLGVSAEDQATLDARVPVLLRTPAAVRVVSLEPLLEAVQMSWCLPPKYPDLDRAVSGMRLPDIDGVFVGGESGPHARPCDIGWIRSVVQQCQAAGTKVFVKQVGSRPWVESTYLTSSGAVLGWPEAKVREYYGSRIEVKLHDRHGADPAEWPADLREARELA